MPSQKKRYHFKHEANINENLEEFLARLLKIREDIRHYREDVLDKKEVYELACTHKYLGELFSRKYENPAVDIAAQLSPVFTTEFNGCFIKVAADSTVESLRRQYEQHLPVPEWLNEPFKLPRQQESPSSEKYRMIIYCAVATFHFYRKEIIFPEEGETLGVFAEKNAVIVKRVAEEVRNMFDYDMSHLQMGKAIEAYLAPAQSVSATAAATRE